MVAANSLDLGVESPQLQVVGGHLGVKAQVDVGLIGGAGLGIRAGGLDRAAHAAPEVRLPTGLAAERKVVVRLDLPL